VATDVVPATNDKQQLQPMPSKLGALAVELGKAVTLLNRVHFENHGYVGPNSGNAPVHGASGPDCQTTVSKLDAV
jgi:hypothetical protein